MIRNVFLHTRLVLHHKWEVLKLCIHAGIPLQGFVHDLSKFSPSEFPESVKYYNGHRSPLAVSRQENGYSPAWLHHKGRNRHHWEYWIDVTRDGPRGCLMPRKYAMEMICDMIAASKIYEGERFTCESPLRYFQKVEAGALLHPAIHLFMSETFRAYAQKGPEAINAQNLRKIYDRCANTYKAGSGA